MATEKTKEKEPEQKPQEVEVPQGAVQTSRGNFRFDL